MSEPYSADGYCPTHGDTPGTLEGSCWTCTQCGWVMDFHVCTLCCQTITKDDRDFMVNDDVWEVEAGLPEFGCIAHLACFQHKLGRTVEAADIADYAHAPINRWLVAHLVERCFHTAEVAGSKPAEPTIVSVAQPDRAAVS